LQWQGYFSYNLVRDIAESLIIFFCFRECIVSKNLNTNELKNYNTVDGLNQTKYLVLELVMGSCLLETPTDYFLVVNTNNSINIKNGIVEEIPVSPFIKDKSFF
jgi:hypothetical protein